MPFEQRSYNQLPTITTTRPIGIIDSTTPDISFQLMDFGVSNPMPIRSTSISGYFGVNNNICITDYDFIADKTMSLSEILIQPHGTPIQHFTTNRTICSIPVKGKAIMIAQAPDNTLFEFKYDSSNHNDPTQNPFLMYSEGWIVTFRVNPGDEFKMLEIYNPHYYASSVYFKRENMNSPLPIVHGEDGNNEINTFDNNPILHPDFPDALRSARRQHSEQ